MHSATSTPPPLPAADTTLRDLDRGCRIGFLALTFVLALVTIYTSWQVFAEAPLAKIHAGIFKGSPQPLSVELVTTGQSTWLPLACALTSAAFISAFAIKRTLHALVAIALCNATLAAIFALFAIALFETGTAFIRALT